MMKTKSSIPGLAVAVGWPVMKTFALLLLLACLPCCFGQTDAYLITAGDWSAPVSDEIWTLRGRLLVSHPAPQTETKKSFELWNGARVYLELQNVSRVKDPIEIFIPGYLPMNCEMRDGHDKLLIGFEVWQLPDGPQPPQFTVTLPGDSTLRMPANTLVGTRNSDRWIIGLPKRSWEMEFGGTNEYFLSATFSPPTNHPSDLNYHVWQGTLRLPKVEIPVNNP
jgi:hypothetical protein